MLPRGGPRRLGDIVKLPLLKRETKDRIGEIWKGYHENRTNAVGRAVEAHHASMLLERAIPAPTFLFPVHREGGHFMLLSQFQKNHVLFTYLEDFKKNPAFARPRLTLALHDDLAKDKGIVLLRGDIEPMLSKPESDHLITQLFDTYLVASRYFAPTTGPLNFTQSPHTFDHDAYLRAYPRRPM
ncbi:hypothetical protein CTAYLR_007516 [Chrysophaeum taylorii]|uniref:ATP synthase mitochondrial F1 complex assembly factor 1 n=1 Tax=Chrysophaeum taylorii TaxID=2483200 RepID=A0AAD7U8Y7_9STRA|nr:hypothetical protein CTAYLR_007516 [Chrysophaeum taylorii]